MQEYTRTIAKCLSSFGPSIWSAIAAAATAPAAAGIEFWKNKI